MFFADDTTIMVTNYNQGGSQIALHKTLSDITSWFRANFPSLNFNKTYYLEFTLNINHLNWSIANVTDTTFLSLVIDGTSLTWDNHTEQLISRLNAIKAVQAMLSGKVLQMLYFSYAHSIITYGIIFWSNTPNSIKIFRRGGE